MVVVHELITFWERVAKYTSAFLIFALILITFFQIYLKNGENNFILHALHACLSQHVVVIGCLKLSLQNGHFPLLFIHLLKFKL